MRRAVSASASDSASSGISTGFKCRPSGSRLACRYPQRRKASKTVSRLPAAVSVAGREAAVLGAVGFIESGKYPVAQKSSVRHKRRREGGEGSGQFRATAGRANWPATWYTVAPMLKHIAWKDVELEHLNPLFDRQMVTGEKLMLARLVLRKGSIVPEHSHENE